MSNALHNNSLVDGSDAINAEQTITYYAPSTKGFYTTDIHDVIPADAIAISDSLYQELLTGESAGLIITPPDDTHDLPYLSEPPAPTVDEAKTIKLAEIMSGYTAAFSEIEKKYPAAEREGWAVQEAEATTYLADSSAETPVLSVLVEQRGMGETIAELAQKVIANATTWRTVYAVLTGQQQRMYAEVTALETVEEILEYTVTFSLE